MPYRHGGSISFDAVSFPKLLIFALGLSGFAQAAISIQNFSSADNDRFADDASFIAAGYDWSGVGRASNGTWATMIAPNVFLSAAHSHPSTGATLTFFAGNDPGATPVTGTVAGGMQISGTDLWIGYLSSPLPDSIASYSFVTTPLTEIDFPTSAFVNEPSYMSGNSPTTTGYGSSPLTNQAVGTNRIERFQEDTTITGSSSIGDTLWAIQNEAGDSGFIWTNFEADLNSGDSGSPLMIVSGGQLVVAGIAWASGTTDIQPGPGETTRNLSIYTYLGSHVVEIQGFIGSHPVPEPGVLMLAFAGAGVFMLRRR